MKEWLIKYRIHLCALFVAGLSLYLSLAELEKARHNLTALAFHFETQPIPTPIAWYAHQLPLWFLKGSTLMTLVIEIAVPFLILAPRRLRAAALAAHRRDQCQCKIIQLAGRLDR